MKLRLRNIVIENFKGITLLMVNFADRTVISGQNATGKTTIMDSFMWLLFGKDSQGKADFSIRPNDRDGKVIDNVVIKVTATLDADGREIVLTKTQEQNWVKKRGSEVAQLQGNVNSYEINEIPKTEKDYKAYISDLIGEDLFKLMTSPQAFTSMKWKDQRAILLELVSEVTDQDVIATDDKFEALADLLANASVEDLTAKTKKALKELSKRQAELPARIDEASKGLIDADFAACEAQKADLEAKIKELEAQEGDASKTGEAMAKLQNEITQKQAALGELKRKANELLVTSRREVQNRIDNAQSAFASEARRQAELMTQISNKTDLLEYYRTLRQTLLTRHKETTAMQMDSDACSCPMCGQSLPEEQREAKIEEFHQKKEAALKEIVQTGKHTAADIIALEAEIKELTEQLEACKAGKIVQNGRETKALEEMYSLPHEVDLTGDKDYQAMLAEIRQLEGQARSMMDGTNYLDQIRRNKAALVAELDKVKTVLSGKENNQRVQDRINELQLEQRSLSQKIANQEKGLFLLEEFTKAKMDMLSTRINSKFKLVNFRLFETQINGGYKETCECMVGGVPFSSLNAGHRVIAGLDIISALQEIYGVTAPIFIDNAESINDFNVPNMDGQLILLKVSDNKELKVEV